MPTLHQGYSVQYHANAHSSPYYDGGDSMELAPADVGQLGIHLDVFDDAEFLKQVAPVIDDMVRAKRKDISRITSMHLLYAQPSRAKQWYEWSVSAPSAIHRSPRMWAMHAGATVQNFEDLYEQYPDDQELLQAHLARYMSEIQGDARSITGRVIFMPQPDGESGRIHIASDHDLLYTPNTSAVLPAVSTGRSSLAARAHAFRSGETGNYDPGLTVDLPQGFAVLLQEGDMPWSAEKLATYGTSVMALIHNARKDVQRITSLRLLQLDEATREKFWGCTVIPHQVRKHSPTVWPLHKGTRVCAFDPHAFYAKGIQKRWNIQMGQPGIPDRIIVTPRPNDESVHIHPLTEQDVLLNV